MTIITGMSALEDLRTNLCADLNEHIQKAFQEPHSPTDRLKDLVSLSEYICRYLADLYNSEYMSRPQHSDPLEKMLRSHSTSNLSFGHFLGGIRGFASDTDCASPQIPELQQLCLAELPISAKEFVCAMKLGKKGRGFEIPATKIGSYVHDALKGFNNNPKFLDLAAVLVEIRNAYHHPPDYPWWSRDPIWYEWLNERLQPAICDLLVWQPLRQLLTAYTRVQLLNAVQEMDGKWLVSYRLEKQPPHAWPLRASSVRSAKRPGETFYIQHTDQGCAYLFEHAEFPSGKVSHTDEKQTYLQLFLHHYLAQGMIDKVTREQYLEECGKKFGFSKSETARWEGELQILLTKIAGAAAGERIAELREMIGDPEGLVTRDLDVTLMNLSTRLKDVVLGQVADALFVSLWQLQQVTQLSFEVLNKVLDTLKDDGAIREFSGLGNEKFYSAALIEPIRRLEQLLADLKTGSIEFDAVITEELVRLCYNLLPAGEGNNSIEKAINGAFGKSSQIAAASAEDKAPLRIILDGMTIEVSDVRSLFGRICELVGDEQRFKSGVPFLVGRTSYLLNSKPIHENGAPFQEPYQFGEYHFEGHGTPWTALFNVTKYLESCGFSVSIPDFDVAEINPDSDVSSRTEPGSGTSPLDEVDGDQFRNRLGVIVGGFGEAGEIYGTTVASFFTNLLKFIDEHRLLDQDVLPFAAGRIRYLIAEKPVHADGKRKFRTVISAMLQDKNGDDVNVCMEAAFSRDDAIAHARSLLKALAVEDVEEVNLKDRLRVTLEGDLIDGDTVRDFVTKILEWLKDRGNELDARAPFPQNGGRYLFNTEPIHSNGDDFVSVLDWEGLSFEINISYVDARKHIAALLESLGVQFKFELVSPTKESTSARALAALTPLARHIGLTANQIWSDLDSIHNKYMS